MVGYFHDLATELDLTTRQRQLVTFVIWLQEWMLTTGQDTVGHFYDLATGVEADHWTVMFGYFHDQTALRVVYFSRKLDVAQSWCGHVGAQASNKMVIIQRTVSLCA